MRKLVALLTLVFALPFTLSAQHGPAPSPGTPIASGIHAAPAAPPVVHSATVHLPVVPAPIHVARPGNAASGNLAKPATPHRRNPVPSPSQPTVNAGTGYPVASQCNQHFSYPIQGLSACPAPQIPYYGAAYYIPIPYYVDTSAAEQEQVQGDEQEQAANGEPEADNSLQASDQSTSPTEPGTSTDSLSEFVFVQRDGSKLYAVAYSFAKDKLQYVTLDGVRHTLGVELLDFDATQKINEQLGNTINLPSLPASGVALNVSPAPLR